MSTSSLEKSHAYHDITHYVNSFGSLSPMGIQLQKLRCLRHRESGEWLLDFDFYPSPRRSFWVLGPESGGWGWLEGARPPEQVFVSAQNPLFLYLKSHFIGKRVLRLTLAETGVTFWDFGEGYAWCVGLKTRDTLEWRLLVPGKKPFVKELKLFSASFLASPDAPDATPSVVASSAKSELKNLRLIQNIRQDQATARAWVTQYASLCHELENRPWLWHAPEPTDAIWDAQISTLQASGLLPQNREAGYLKLALDKLFNERSRQERKIAKAGERLAVMEAKFDSGELRQAAQQERAKFSPEKLKQKSHPGLRIEIQTGLYGYLGRSAKENALLFKWVRDRDFWFHVRGYSGTHLWILRSDLKLGKDDPLPFAIKERAAKIALYNSKLKNSGSGSVDVTEKRYLKKLKGELASLKISKSEVLLVSLEEGFEKTLKWR